MALWLIRAGRHGQHEQRFLDESRVYLTWSGVSEDLGRFHSRDEIKRLLADGVMPNAGNSKLAASAGQLYAFAHRMEPGDWVVVPSKLRPVIHVAEITGSYTHNPDGEDPYFHYRPVKWIAQDVPKTNFDQDVLSSFGALMTICQIKRNDAEQRVRRMATNNWQACSAPWTNVRDGTSTAVDSDDASEDEATYDLEQTAQDQIAKLIKAKFKGHGMETLVNAILQAQGYTTHLSPEGPDKGVDILAGRGPMGFDEPRICVQVKSTDGPVDHPTLSQLIGTMQNMQAQYGLLVSWGGFKSTIDRERAAQFFRVRLWDQADLIEKLLEQYDHLPEHIRVELPLKRIWAIAYTSDESD